jgi:hypothetical protein
MKLTFSLLLLFATSLLVSAAFLYRQEATVQGTSERGPVRMVRFVLSDDGLYPARMQVDQGLLNLAVEDKTGRSEGLLVESLQGTQRSRVTQITRAPDRSRGRALLKLPPGRYLVSDASQPSHTAELVVNP